MRRKCQTVSSCDVQSTQRNLCVLRRPFSWGQTKWQWVWAQTHEKYAVWYWILNQKYFMIEYSSIHWPLSNQYLLEVFLASMSAVGQVCLNFLKNIFLYKNVIKSKYSMILCCYGHTQVNVTHLPQTPPPRGGFSLCPGSTAAKPTPRSQLYFWRLLLFCTQNSAREKLVYKMWHLWSQKYLAS